MSIYSRYGTNEVVSMESAEPVQDPVRDLYKACTTISMEAAEMGSIAGFFVRAGNNLSMAIKRGFDFLTTWNYAPLPALNPGNMRSIVRTLDYMELQSKPVSQPRGFTGNLHDYVMAMEPRIMLAAQLKTNVLEPAIKRLGHYMSNPTERTDRRDFVGGGADVAQTGKALADEAKFYGKGDNQATAEFGQLFNNLQEFVQTEYKLVEYATILKNASPTDIRASVDNLASVAQGLLKSMGTDPTSKQLTQAIGQELQNAAKWVEWYAVQYTKLVEVTQVCSTIEADIR